MDNDLRLTAWQEYMKKSLGKSAWVPVYEYFTDEHTVRGFFCALLPPEQVDKSLRSYDWDLHIGSGMPGHVIYGTDDNNYRYYRFGDDTGIEPFVYSRSAHGMKPEFIEISEEFRHYFNLFPAENGNKLVAVDDSGDDVDVVRGLQSDKVEVSLQYLKKYLATKDMVLAVFFDIDAFDDDRSFKELGIEAFKVEQKGDDYAYLCVSAEPGLTGGHKAFTRLLGKKIIRGSSNYKPKLNEREEEYEDFIIGTDDDGKPVSHTSDEDKLGNYFGKNPDAPHFLQPVFFSREVLNRYYDDPRFEVEDGNLSCGGLWGLRMDNDHEKYVVVALGDLGHMPYKHQLHWKHYNVLPDGTYSDTAIARGFKAEFADAQRPDLVFKAQYRLFMDEWPQDHGWELLLPLDEKDMHHFNALHIPKADNQREFDEQVQGIAKLLIDSLNAKGLQALPQVTSDKGTLAMLEEWVTAVQPELVADVKFLRKLQDLRSSGSAHRKGRNYTAAAKYFDIETIGLEKAFENILQQAAEVLKNLPKLPAAT